MGGVDRADRNFWNYLHTHKSVKWWKKVVFYLLELCFVNALVIYRSFHLGPQRIDKLRLAMINGLLEGYQRCQIRGRRQALEAPFRLTERHFVGVTQREGYNPDCIVCSDRKKKRHQTKYICIECDLPMCPVPCHRRYHTRQNYRVACSKDFHSENL
ncbi:PiggyBac transposable element-derived protein 4 [Holothuria leucospilota]|uniref:PiggyBac transposable element-derived protein 4 n=1 Tax=Holothuria leucospilota TaxID=206669 RepID=A0A9Q1CQJ4_HOLLE|nr:PiggyBac transposable element-derived protein 4 [Holothuria leucospilota]